VDLDGIADGIGPAGPRIGVIRESDNHRGWGGGAGARPAGSDRKHHCGGQKFHSANKDSSHQQPQPAFGNTLDTPLVFRYIYVS